MWSVVKDPRTGSQAVKPNSSIVDTTATIQHHIAERFAQETTPLTKILAAALFRSVPITSVLPSADAHILKSSRPGMTTWVELTGDYVSGDDNKEGVRPGSALCKQGRRRLDVWCGRVIP